MDWLDANTNGNQSDYTVAIEKFNTTGTGDIKKDYAPVVDC